MRASQRLTDSAACLVASAQGRDRELERLLARQNRGSGAKPILELNMAHDLVKALAGALGEKRETDVSDLAALLLDQAQILDGEVPADPAGSPDGSIRSWSAGCAAAPSARTGTISDNSAPLLRF